MLQIISFLIFIFGFTSVRASAQSLSLDEAFPNGQFLCGKPSLFEDTLESRPSEKNLFALDNLMGQSWTVSSDAQTFAVLQTVLDEYLFICIPVDDSAAIKSKDIIAISWFIYWSAAGSGVSVSNQKQ